MRAFPHSLNHSLTRLCSAALHLYNGLAISFLLSFFRSRFRRRVDCDRSRAMLLLVHRHRGGRHRHHHHHHRLRPAYGHDPHILTTTMAVMICSMMVMGRAVCTSTRTSAVLDRWMDDGVLFVNSPHHRHSQRFALLLFCCFSPRRLLACLPACLLA